MTSKLMKKALMTTVFAAALGLGSMGTAHADWHGRDWHHEDWHAHAVRMHHPVYVEQGPTYVAAPPVVYAPPPPEPSGLSLILPINIR